MMLDQTVQQELKNIWDNYKAQGHKVLDTKGREFDNIDKSRLVAIEDIKRMIDSFLQGKLTLPEFKTNLDSYNKQNNYWGFTAAKGQMFFNLITRSSVDSMEDFVLLLRQILPEPNSLADALQKMKLLFNYVAKYQQTVVDKRTVANPSSSAYFLSYFWQIYNPDKWPVMYSSIIVSFEKLGIWQQHDTAYDNYGYFFSLNQEVKQILSIYTSKVITNWDVEHALWNFAGPVTVSPKQLKPRKNIPPETVKPPIVEPPVLKAGFELSDYLIPRVAKLLELGGGIDKGGSAKGRDFERMVGETFRLLDFDVEFLGQGTGREPDAIIKYPGEHIAFLVDAKAYSSGYTLGTDDRAIREYINHHGPRLKNAGFNKIGFIIVSNSFKSDLKELINDITWTTDIKRFLLLTTEALLYLVAYKTKDKIPITQIVQTLIAFEKVITKEMIIEEFEDY